VAVAHPRRSHPNRAATAFVPRRSNAAIPVALVVVGVGVYLARFTLLLPAFLGFVLLAAGVSFVSTRVNPLSSHFYLPTKPSWAAVLVVVLGALGLLAFSYEMFVRGLAPVMPRL
jgi:hypothetical protein